MAHARCQLGPPPSGKVKPYPPQKNKTKETLWGQAVFEDQAMSGGVSLSRGGGLTHMGVQLPLHIDCVA